jgi:hypothetical protein
MSFRCEAWSKLDQLSSHSKDDWILHISDILAASHRTAGTGQLISYITAIPLTLIRRSLHVWHPALGNVMALQIASFGYCQDHFNERSE